MKKTKLLFVIACLDMGGAEKSLVRLLSKLNPDNYDITVLVNHGHKGVLSDQIPDYVKLIYIYRYKTLSYKKQYPNFYNLINDFVSKKRFGEHPVKNSILNFILRSIGKFEYKHYLKYVAKLLKHEFFDVSIGFVERDSSVIATHCINAKKKYIFYRHGNVFSFRGDDESFEKCDKLITLSKKVRDDLISKKRYDARKIQIIHNVYDTDNIIRLSKEPLKYNQSVINIVSVGRLHPDKGQLRALKAAKILKDKGFKFNWYFVGLDEGDYATECKNVVKKYDIEDNIIFTGLKKNPYPYFKFADIYVLPSDYESLGNTIVEATILGKPIVSTKTSGALELISDGESGILCDFEADALANAIISIINDEQLKQKLINNAQKSLEGFEKEIEKYIELFSV